MTGFRGKVDGNEQQLVFLVDLPFVRKSCAFSAKKTYKKADILHSGKE